MFSSGGRIDYYWDNGRLVGEARYTVLGIATNYIQYHYDETGSPIGFTNNGTDFYYAKNLQGDVVAIYQRLNNNGKVTTSCVARYDYDPWGRCTVKTADGRVDILLVSVGHINPFRFKGYYYDSETGFYYLQSRYYDPAIGRFINADVLASTGQGFIGYNKFSYCGNNPVMLFDPMGMAPQWWQVAVSAGEITLGLYLISTGVGGYFGGALLGAGVNSLLSGAINESFGGTYTAGWIGGMASGFFAAYGAGIGGKLFEAATNSVNMGVILNLGKSLSVSYLSGFFSSFVGNTIKQIVDSRPINAMVNFRSSITSGMINIFAGIGSGMATVAYCAGNSAAYKALSCGIASLGETIADGIEYVAYKVEGFFKKLFA